MHKRDRNHGLTEGSSEPAIACILGIRQKKPPIPRQWTVLKNTACHRGKQKCLSRTCTWARPKRGRTRRPVKKIAQIARQFWSRGRPRAGHVPEPPALARGKARQHGHKPENRSCGSFCAPGTGDNAQRVCSSRVSSVAHRTKRTQHTVQSSNQEGSCSPRQGTVPSGEAQDCPEGGPEAPFFDPNGPASAPAKKTGRTR